MVWRLYQTEERIKTDAQYYIVLYYIGTSFQRKEHLEIFYNHDLFEI